MVMRMTFDLAGSPYSPRCSRAFQRPTNWRWSQRVASAASATLPPGRPTRASARPLRRKASATRRWPRRALLAAVRLALLPFYCGRRESFTAANEDDQCGRPSLPTAPAAVTIAPRKPTAAADEQARVWGGQGVAQYKWRTQLAGSGASSWAAESHGYSTANTAI